MAETTRYLGLPLIAAAQAQKHVTHNEALTALDALVQLTCLDKDLTAPPGNPAEGDRYLVASPSPTGAWAALSGQIVRLEDGVWVGAAPGPGWLAYVIDEADLYTFTGTAWISFRSSLTALQNLARLGVGTTADATNRLAVKSEAALFSWDDATPGSGSLRLTLNKQNTAKDAGLSFQTGFSARALFGTLGTDDVALKVSPNGTTFATALNAAVATGKVGFPAGIEGTNIGAVTPGTGAFTALSGSGTATFTGAPGANRVLLNGPGSNWIAWAAAGAAAPSFATRSLGTKLVLYPQLDAANADYALGIESAALWTSVPTASAAFKWYGGTALAATLSGTGALTANGLGLGGATPDATNRLSLNTPAILINHAGDSVQAKLNKAAVGNDAACLFQTGFSSRALIGLLGSDDLTIKTSADGASFATAASFSTAGKATFGAGIENTAIGAATAAAARVTTLTATGTFALQQGGVVGGTAVPTRSATFDTYGRITWRYDDNGYVTGPVLNNYGLTGIGQGANVMQVNLGTAGALVASAGNLVLATTDAFTSAGTASAKWRFQAATAGALGIGLEVSATFAATPMLGLMPKATDPSGASLGQIYANSTATALKWHNGTAWARINNFAKAAAYASADTYAAAGTWTKVAFNSADSNDQGAFVAATSRFVAPEGGLYAFSVALVFKKNGTNNPTAMEIQLYKNAAAAGRGRAAATGTLVDGVTTLDLSAMLKLVANDYVEVFVRFTTTDGYAAAADSFFGGTQLA